MESTQDQRLISDSFLDEQIMTVRASKLPWFADIVNYLVSRQIPEHWNKNERERFLSQVRHYYWDEPELFKYCADQIIRRCVLKEEYESILSFCHSLACGGHFSSRKTVAKVLQS